MNNWSLKKLGEAETVKKFFTNQGLRFDDSKLNMDPEEPSDIEYQDKKFQVIFSDFEFHSLLGSTPKDPFGVKFIKGRVRGPNEIWIDYVINPLRKKSKYGRSAKGVTLLISCHMEPPWLEKQIELAKTLESNVLELKKLHFEEIYLVFPKRNLRLFP